MRQRTVVKEKSGIGFFGLLGVVFIALKLTGHVGWSWWLVLAPLWGPPVAAGLILLIFASIAAWADS